MATSTPGERYVGLISGTSMDGIDAVVVEFGTDRPEVLAALTRNFDDRCRDALDEVRRDPDHFPVARLGSLDAILGDSFADAALVVIESAGLAPGDIAAIGSHGQTIVHHAEADPPYTLQIGDPNRIARRTDVTTVADFRRADLACGGQGAPLAPLLHDALFRDETEARAVVNLGGIANVTLLAPGRPVVGLDTGPANCFLDLWFRAHHHGERFDADGRWAASGRVDSDWLEALLADPYFALPAPKSTGIEYFSAHWLRKQLPSWAEARPQDVQATLAELSAVSLSAALAEAAGEARIDRVLICGGGVKNRHLVDRIQAQLEGVEVDGSDAHGLDPDHVESVLFAWLARLRIRGQRVDARSVTGARQTSLLGSLFEA